MKLFNRRLITDITGENGYLERWSIVIPILGWSIKLHRIMRADDDRCQHDHPWWFVRLIVWGGYEEFVGNRNKLKKRWPMNLSFCGPKFRHRIVRLYGKVSWSLVITGKNSGRWGFYTKEGFMPWRKFVNLVRKKRIMWCDDGEKL